MYTVYILSDNSGKLYKGVTNNLPRRLQEHRSGKTVTTSKMGILSVIYTEIYDSFKVARRRELYLKSSAGRRYLKKLQIPRD